MVAVECERTVAELMSVRECFFFGISYLDA